MTGAVTKANAIGNAALAAGGGGGFLLWLGVNSQGLGVLLGFGVLAIGGYFKWASLREMKRHNKAIEDD